MRLHSLAAGLLLTVIGVGMPRAAEAQKPTTATSEASTAVVAETLSACYIPATGTVYRVGAPGLPGECLASTHVAFSWNDAGPQGEVGPEGPAGAQGDPGPEGPPGEAILPTNAAGAYDLGNDNGLLGAGTFDTGAIPAAGAGIRMMWYPARFAFRAGRVESLGATYWDAANVGYGSAAFGENTRASGDHSFAANLSTLASGDGSVALGSSGTASGDRAFAFNGSATAVGAIAMGSDAQATAIDAVAIGPSSMASGRASVAIGTYARTANRTGSIVISDAPPIFTSDSVYATADNQFVVRAVGGIRMYTTTNLTAGVAVAPGGGAWSSISDRARKQNFTAVDGEDVLRRLGDVPVSAWNYIAQDAGIRHMGAMAQDFHAAFGLGESELLINSVDMDGINLAAVKALIERTDRLARENADMRDRLDRLEALVREMRQP